MQTQSADLLVSVWRTISPPIAHLLTCVVQIPLTVDARIANYTSGDNHCTNCSSADTLSANLASADTHIMRNTSANGEQYLNMNSASEMSVNRSNSSAVKERAATVKASAAHKATVLNAELEFSTHGRFSTLYCAALHDSELSCIIARKII